MPMARLENLLLLCSVFIFLCNYVTAQRAYELEGGVCAVDGLACAMGSNVIRVVPDIRTTTECRALCKEETSSSCFFITHFGPNSFPFQDTCVLFSKMETFVLKSYRCNDCRTEDAKCWSGACSSPVESRMTANLVKFIAGDPLTPGGRYNLESECQASCASHRECSFYTFHTSLSPSHAGGCFLLSSLEQPLKPCDHCRTGPADCAHSCLFLTENKSNSTKGLMFPDPSNGEHLVTVLQPLALGSCQLTVLAMGRGGTYNGYGGGGGGQGSGFLEWTKISFVGLTRLSIGWSSSGTTVFMEDNKDFLSVRPGGQNENSVGGNGYSGGGCSSDGGSNGSNGTSAGRGCRAGMGSGLLLEDIPLNSFTLTPGAPGKGTIGGGGGGGGILVDGKGPPSLNRAYGEGYGAGGGKGGFVLLDFN